MTNPFSQARWVWSTEDGDPRFAVRRFRCILDVLAAETVTLHVSADSRYVLFLDGQPIGRGPARSDLSHYVYETYHVTVEPGRHILASIVVSFGRDTGPVAEMHDRGAFLLEAHGQDGAVLCATGADEGWRVQVDTAYQPQPMTMHNGYYAIGASESVDGTAIPQGWTAIDFDDAVWEAPRILLEPYQRERPGDLADPGGRWRLIPRDIPFLREEPRQFVGWHGPLAVPAHSRREIVLDAGAYADGYPVLEVEGGAGSTVQIFYAESLSKDGQKAVRDSREGTDVVGFGDTYRPGGAAETYSPLHWRAFWFVKLVIKTADAPLTVRDFSYLLTGYPWERKAAFTVENGPSELPQVMDIDFRTLERCTTETFMDCPYYEQLQYVGDTRLQALLSYVTTGDTRLGARAVRLFDWSRLPEGLTQSRYPSNMPQIIPPFSLIWVLMVEDLYRYAPDEVQTVGDCLSGCRGVLEWFGKHLTVDGVLGGAMPWWNFVDWAKGWNVAPHHGVPPPAAHGLPCATINLQYLAALQAYIRLCDGLGNDREVEFWQAEADMLADAILATFWDAERQLLREGPDDAWGFTQHAQAWGILTDVVPKKAVSSVADALHADDTLTKTTYYHTFYVVEALAKAGRLEQFWEHWLAPWRAALDLHLTTWPEEPEPTRSDCHAWSAWPTYSFLTHALGIQPAEPGFATHEITPRRVQGWDRLSGTIPTPSGLLSVKVEWDEAGEARVKSKLRPLGPE